MNKGKISDAEIKHYSKYANLEEYLFNSIQKNFEKNHQLTPEEFYTIVIWKANRAKTLIKRELRKSNISIKKLSRDLYSQKDPKEKIKLLVDIKGIGYPIASAILSVCYPDEYTIVDYRVKKTMTKLGIKIDGNPSANADAYLDYVMQCKKLANDNKVSLRSIDKYLWGYDFFEGTNGLAKFVKGLE